MNHTILHIDSSPLGERSVTRRLSAKAVAEIKAKYPHSKVITRDLAAHPLPHLDGTTIGAFFTPADQRSAPLAEAVKLSDELVAELLSADAIVIGAPMWNFGIPSGLKAWIDHVIRAGLTFKYGANGVEPLIPPGKKTIIVSSRGGKYAEGPMQAMDFQENYLRSVLGFVGLKDITFARAEGVAMGDEATKAAVLAAEKTLDEAVHGTV